MDRLEIYMNISRNEGGNMKCEICGESTIEERSICDRCTKIMDDVIRSIDPDIWKGITQDVINTLLKGETD